MSQAAIKAEARRVPPQEPIQKRLKPTETITLSEEDAVPTVTPHTDALVVKALIANKEVRRVHIDQGSAVDVMYLDCFNKLGLDMSSVTPTISPLTGFGTEVVKPVGRVYLAVTMGTYPRNATFLSRFYVIDAPSPFNVIIGRPWLNAAKAIPSTYHLCMKFPTPQGVAVVRGDQFAAKECMRIALKGKSVDSGVLSIQQDEESSPRGTPKDRKLEEGISSNEAPVADITEEVENIVLDPRFPDRTVQVGATLPLEVKTRVIQLLRQYQQVFAWGP